MAGEFQDWVEWLDAYREAQKRLIFLDYDGTLVPFYDDPKLARPSRDLHGILTCLAGDFRNEVIIISGRDRQTLEGWLGDLGLTIIAEHGVWIKEKNSPWRTLETLRTDWKAEVREILEHYVQRLTGTFIEEKTYSLAWHYRKADPANGPGLAAQLREALLTCAKLHGLQVLDGHCVVEIRPLGVDKGVAALRCLGKDGGDFIMAIGDDRTDEDLFKALPDSAYTIKVGEGPTAAKFRLPDQASVVNMLKNLVK